MTRQPEIIYLQREKIYFELLYKHVCAHDQLAS